MRYNNLKNKINNNKVIYRNSSSKDSKTLVNLTAQLITEESRRGKRNGNDQNIAFQASHRSHAGGSRQKRKNFAKFRCNICKNPKNNHDESKCFFRNKPSNPNGKRVALLVHENKTASSDWILDSGASSHMTNDVTQLHSKISSDAVISVANQENSMRAKFQGTVEGTNCSLHNVLYVPELSKNLLSVPALTSRGAKVIFADDDVRVIKDDEVILEGQKTRNGLFEIKLGRDQAHLASENTNVIWHKKMAHLSEANLEKLSKMSTGMTWNKNQSIPSCEICLKAKATRVPFGKNRTKAQHPLQILHADVCGPFSETSWNGYQYFLSVLDDKTHYAAVFLLKSKSEVKDRLIDYITKIENKWERKVKTLRMDNGGEFVVEELKNFCNKKGIETDYSPPYTPQLNSHAERLNRTLLDKTRALLCDSGLKKEMWSEALLVATYLLNRSPTTALGDTTPAEMWFKRKPNLSRLQIFGSTAYAKNLKHLKKLDDRAKKFIFVGYATNAYRLWDEKKREIIVSRDVHFLDDAAKLPENAKMTSPPEKPVTLDFSDSENECSDESIRQVENGESETEDENSRTSTPAPHAPEEREDEDAAASASDSTRRSSRKKTRPRRLDDFKTNFDESDLDGDESALLTYKAAVTGDDRDVWIAAINDEKEAHEQNGTWTLVDEADAKGKKILTSRWVFRIKDDGRHKARLVVRGCQQIPGVDFEETYSPLVGTDALRIVFAHAVKNHLHFKKFDVRTAFLHGILEEEIFMRLPEGYDSNGKICKLQKALYGLRQASERWHSRLVTVLKKLGLKPMITDQCIFVNKNRSLILAIHVDDGLLFGKNLKEMDSLLKSMKNEFELTVVDNPSTFLGMEFEKTKDSIKITQKAYTESVLRKFRMMESNPAPTPLVSYKPQDQDKVKKSAYPYREAVGALLYLSTKTRPDISFGVGYSGRHVEDPDNHDENNVKRIMKYLKGTLNKGISFHADSPDDLEVYCDSDYAGDRSSTKSTSGYVIYFNGGPVSWKSRKQPTTSTSSTDAELVSAAESCRELIYIKSLIKELTGKDRNATMYIDNTNTIRMIKTGAMNFKRKHIDIKYHWLNEKFVEGLMKVDHVSTELQIADIFTKPLGPTQFNYFRNKLIT
ncbi:unnamed protein product [Nesidiocoris tenuis]|uniref:Integrase catalytic domain-containing protein n=1 Tax=Nesidiocoris tenuis TaxID=355587 RepID=A0A6H5GWU3_9HEMI|nr:unnamed protein product [Nesidiocoris tenuis]